MHSGKSHLRQVEKGFAFSVHFGVAKLLRIEYSRRSTELRIGEGKLEIRNSYSGCPFRFGVAKEHSPFRSFEECKSYVRSQR